MPAEIQIIQGKKESTFPIIRLTKSLNGKTGTASFLFINPNCFDFFFSQNEKIDMISLIYNKKKIETKDFTIIFKEGKPFLLKSIFVFKNPTEWFNFLNFMNQYSKEKGLLFELETFS